MLVANTSRDQLSSVNNHCGPGECPSLKGQPPFNSSLSRRKTRSLGCCTCRFSRNYLNFYEKAPWRQDSPSVLVTAIAPVPGVLQVFRSHLLMAWMRNAPIFNSNLLSIQYSQKCQMPPAEFQITRMTVPFPFLFSRAHSGTSFGVSF